MKHITRFVFAALMLLFAVPAWAYDFEMDGIYYQITNSTAPFEVGVTNNNDNPNSYSGHVVIPNQVYHNGITYAVTSILFTGSYHGAFWNCTESLSVELPNSIREIGMAAFFGCTGLTSISIPQSVEHIDRGAFAGCSALTTVNYNAINCVMTTGAPLVFTGCSSVSTLNIGEGVEVIPEGAFRGMTGLSSVTIPNSVTSIGKGAFNGSITGTASIIIPNSVTSIGESAFSGCTGITSISLPNSITTVEKNTFSGCTSLTSITIPSSVIEIGVRAFNNCMGLTSVFLPNAITAIRRETFLDCTSLKSITIPTSVTSIEESAFCGCADLPSIELPNSITSIERDAFYGCSSLTSINIPYSIQYICPNAFRGCSSLTSISVDAGNTVYDSRNNCNAIIETEVNTLMCGCKFTIIPNSVTDIGEDAFYGCTGLTSITIPHTITTMWGNPFSYCSNLTSITVESGNPFFDSRNNCNAIIETTNNTLRCGCKNTNTPNSVTDIGFRAFMGCSNLTSITIPNSVMSIGNLAFYGCTSLSSMTIPNSVTIIGAGAFKECTNLSSVTIPNSVVSIGNETFENTALFNNDNNWESGVLYINDCCIRAKQDVIEVEYNINAGTRLIADCAFSGCTSSVSISIPNSVISIGQFAFQGCRNLLSITIPASVTNIGNNAFNSCTNLTKVYVKSITPPTCGVASPFPNYDILLSVPCGSKEAYSNAEIWKNYTNIDEELQLSFSAHSSDETLGNVRIIASPDCESNIATVIAEPANGNMFVSWTVNGQVVSTANPYTFAVEDDIELVANFYGTGVDENTNQLVTVFPNPVNDMVNIECENMKGITLCALDGRVLRTYQSNTNTSALDLTSLSKGVYILRIETREGIFINKKIIKE